MPSPESSHSATPAKAGVQRSHEPSSSSMDPRFRGDGEGGAVLSSVESLRSSIPEEHRHLFDSLLQDIKDYCKANNLPFHLLSSSEAFTKAVGPIHPSLLEPLKLRMERLAHLIKHKEPMPEKPISLTQEQAREIMGRNFLGTKEVEEHFGELSPEQQEALSIIPFSKETLESCKDTHILVADIGLSVMDITKLKKCKGLFHKNHWYKNYLFPNLTQQPSWRLIRKTPVKNSFDKNWEEQQALLDPQTDEIPLARQVVYMMILRFLATGEWLFEKVYVRIRNSDVGSDGVRVGVGYFDEGGLSIDDWGDYDLVGNLGLASARKIV